MSALVKQEQYELEQKIFQNSGEAGVQFVREWLHSAREALNEAWLNAEGVELAKAQGAARVLNQLIRIVTEGPKIRAIKPVAENFTN